MPEGGCGPPWVASGESGRLRSSRSRRCQTASTPKASPRRARARPIAPFVACSTPSPHMAPGTIFGRTPAIPKMRRKVESASSAMPARPWMEAVPALPPRAIRPLAADSGDPPITIRMADTVAAATSSRLSTSMEITDNRSGCRIMDCPLLRERIAHHTAPGCLWKPALHGYADGL